MSYPAYKPKGSPTRKIYAVLWYAPSCTSFKKAPIDTKGQSVSKQGTFTSIGFWPIRCCSLQYDLLGNYSFVVPSFYQRAFTGDLRAEKITIR